MPRWTKPAKKSGRSSTRKKKAVTQGEVVDTLQNYGFSEGMKLVQAFSKLFDEDLPLKNLMQAGNIKIPKETAIFNMSSATDCVSLAMDKCKACVFSKELGKMKTVCYALKSENQYPAVLPYRRRQEEFWLSVSAEEFARQFILVNARRLIKFDKVRFNEAGDFHDQSCVDKAQRIAYILSVFGVECYCYTSRDDLDYRKAKNLVVNGSGFMTNGLVNEFKMVPDGEEPPKGYAKCPQDCVVCDRCSKRGKKTYVNQH